MLDILQTLSLSLSAVSSTDTCMIYITSITRSPQSLNPASCYTGHPQRPAVLRHSRHPVQNNRPRHAWGARGEADAASEPGIWVQCFQMLCVCLSRASWRTLPPAVERSWRRPWNGPLQLPNLISRSVEVTYCALKVCALSLRCGLYGHALVQGTWVRVWFQSFTDPKYGWKYIAPKYISDCLLSSKSS